MVQNLFSVWEGVFESFAEAQGDLDAFESDIWVQKQKAKIKRALDNLEEGKGSASKDYPLPVVVSMLLSQKPCISILDFGGGMGMQYIDLLGKVYLAKERVTYCVVDGKATIENLPSQMKAFPKLRYVSSLDEVQQKYDIVHIGSTLQYIENWQDLLSTLVSDYQPNYFVFSDLLAGDIPTFVTHQIFYEKRIPHQFLNWHEFKGFMEGKLNFSLQFKSKFIHNILDQEKVFPNFGMPKTHQIDRGINAVFYQK